MGATPRRMHRVGRTTPIEGADNAVPVQRTPRLRYFGFVCLMMIVPLFCVSFYDFALAQSLFIWTGVGGGALGRESGGVGQDTHVHGQLYWRIDKLWWIIGAI